MIINIRGTNGSGKSTVVKQLLCAHDFTPIYGCLGTRRPEAYVCKERSPPLYIIGPYQAAKGGGVDSLSSQTSEGIIKLLAQYASLGHIVFEGVIISDHLGCIGAWLLQRKDQVIVAFLDTPLDVCLQAVRTRTGAGAREKHTAARYVAIDRVKHRMIASGLRVETLSRDGLVSKDVLQWLNW